MGKSKNIICEPGDILRDVKIKVLELISLNKTICNNLPNLQIPNTFPSIPSINPSQAVIDFLKDILAVVQGINFEQMRLQLIDWLVEQLRPLEKSLGWNLRLALKSCYACKVNPTIPDWMFRYEPSSIPYINGVPDLTNAIEGAGINIELNKLDLTCLFHINPYSAAGKLLYDGDKDKDLNTFLWYVIQDDNSPPNAPRLWKDPITNQPIAYFSYLENELTGNNAAYIGSTTGGEQDIDPRPMVFKMLIHNDYQEKTLITFLNDYMKSQNPIFDAEKVVPNTIDFIYGTLTNKIDLPEECVAGIVEFEEALKDYINVGIENPDVTVDESFYEFSPQQLTNIKQRTQNKKLGVMPYENCCGRQKSKISFDTLATMHDELKSSVTLNEKISVTKKSVDALVNESASGVADYEKNNASAEFFSSFLTGLQIALTKMVLSPKNLMLIYTLYYLVNGQMSDKIKIKEILKELECIIRTILEELIKKLIYEFLLPLIIKALKDLIICVITKKIKEKQLYKMLTMVSLLPGAIAEKMDKINQLLGKGSQVVDMAQGFTNKINLNSLNNVNLQSGNKGKFCD